MPPNISLEEQSAQLPWSTEVMMVNSSLSARLRSASGPDTLPRKMMANLLSKGKEPHLSLIPRQFKRRKNWRVKRKIRSDHKLAMAKRRHEALKLPVTKGTRLYCELTPGKFPKVAHRGPQHHLERQGVGLVPLPDPSTRECGSCGAPSSVAHTAFDCVGLAAPRATALQVLDTACSELGLRGDHKWWHLSDTHKLRASFCPTRGTVPTPMERPFFSKASEVWKGFYEAAGEAGAPQNPAD